MSQVSIWNDTIRQKDLRKNVNSNQIGKLVNTRINSNCDITSNLSLGEATRIRIEFTRLFSFFDIKCFAMNYFTNLELIEKV